ncbi:MAG: CHRD domain-containing protein [Myxococcales bacterium]
MHRAISVALSFTVVACAGGSKSTESSGSMGSSAMSAGAAQAKLESTGEVPPPNVGSSSPTGMATFTPSGDKISYKVTASGLTSPVTTAHIHSGGPGKAGPVVVPLTISAGSDAGSANGEGTFDASAIKAPPDGSPMSWNDLISGLKSGNLYVNVHTQNNPKGEIRGQIGGQQ